MYKYFDSNEFDTDPIKQIYSSKYSFIPTSHTRQQRFSLNRHKYISYESFIPFFGTPKEQEFYSIKYESTMEAQYNNKHGDDFVQSFVLSQGSEFKTFTRTSLTIGDALESLGAIWEVIMVVSSLVVGGYTQFSMDS